jgi:predicted dehydrogenase
MNVLEQKHGSTTPFRVGIIGLGIMGRRMLRSMVAHPKFNPILGFDHDRAAFEQAKQEAPEMQQASSVEALLSTDLDLVYIATPPASHIDLVRSAITAGTAVLCEKPLAVDVKQSEALVEELTSTGLPHAINFPFASDVGVRTLERLIREGEPGVPQLLDMHFHFSEWPRTWQRDAAGWLARPMEGGFLREVVSHFIYLTLRLLGPIEIDHVRCSYPGIPDRCESWVQASGNVAGIPLRISGGVGGAAPDYNEWTLYGSKASLRLLHWGEIYRGDEKGWSALTPDSKAAPLSGDQLDSLACLLNGGDHQLPDIAMGLEVQRIVESLLSSW